MKMGPIGCSETSVDNHQHFLGNNPEDLNFRIRYVTQG
jgi:hypothetical protein